MRPAGAVWTRCRRRYSRRRHASPVTCQLDACAGAAVACSSLLDVGSRLWSRAPARRSTRSEMSLAMCLPARRKRSNRWHAHALITHPSPGVPTRGAKKATERARRLGRPCISGHGILRLGRSPHATCTRRSTPTPGSRSVWRARRRALRSVGHSAAPNARPAISRTLHSCALGLQASCARVHSPLFGSGACPALGVPARAWTTPCARRWTW